MEGGDSLRVGLGIAPADGDHRLRVFPSDPADDLAGFASALRRDGTGVDNVRVRLLRKGDGGMAPVRPEALHGLGFVLVDFTAEGVKCGSHGGSPLWKP